jgi:glycosyltransferase involved in cell wall biosynthesis
MNIAHVYPHSVINLSPVRVTDALAIVIYEIARRLAKDHTVTGYLRRKGNQDAIEAKDGVTWCRVPVIVDRALNSLKVFDKLGLRPASRPYRLSPLYYANYARRVARDIRARSCEIVHIHGITNFVPVIRRYNPNARVVLHVHDHSLADFDHAILEARLADTALILGCSDHISNGIRQRFPPFAERCHTLYNGVDERFLEFRSRPAQSQALLFVGRVSPEKGVHVLLEAFQRVASRYPQADMRIVGPLDCAPKQFVDPFDRDPLILPLKPFYSNAQSYADQLYSVASTLGARVKFEGVVANADITSQYAQAGIFVFPFVWHEPFGIPIIEAMASGLPVIATKGGAASEIVVHGETGLLVERGDVSALSMAIGTLLDDPQLRLRMGNAGRDRAARLFTWDRVVSLLTRLYEEVLSARPTPGCRQ